MPTFNQIADLADRLAVESSRLKKRAAIASSLTEAHPESGLFALYLAGSPFPEADARKLNAGGALLTKALLAVSHASDAALTAAYRKHGDLGAAAFDLLLPNDSPGLPLSEVAEIFADMATARTTAIRVALAEDLLRRATPLEAKYLLKLMLGDMRTGVKQSLVEEAIAIAANADVTAVRNAVMLEADLASATDRAFAGTLAEARMRLFHPLGFMLASPVETPEEAVERFSEKPPVIKVLKVPKSKKKKKSDPDEAVPENSLTSTPEEIPKTQVRESGHGAPNESSNMGAPHPNSQTWDSDETSATDLGAPRPDFRTWDPKAAQSLPEADHSGASSIRSHVIHAFLEDKYDGMRAQIHCGDPANPGRVAIYSRNREDVTESFPEIEEAFANVPAGLGGLIFDGEILGWDFEAGRALPFAVLGQRLGRKRVTNEWRQAVPVIFMTFDLMYAKGELLLDLSLRDRRNRLEAAVETLVEQVRSPILLREKPSEAKKKVSAQNLMFAADEPEGQPASPPLERLLISPSRLVESAEDIDRAYADARARSNEGVMLKAAGSQYQPGRRGLAWVKLKRELATLDVVVTGAEFGHGRRAGILSDYTFAVRDSDGTLQNVGKAYSGLTDVEIAATSAWMMEHTLEDQGHFRTVEPLMIFEVAFNNIMRSNRHPSGFAMRFPRILRIRTDKPLAEIDTVERVEEIYQSQVDKPAEATIEA